MFQLANFKPYCCHLCNCYLLLLVRLLDPCVRILLGDFVSGYCSTRGVAASDAAIGYPRRCAGVPLPGCSPIVRVPGESRLPGMC
jgi:hypothetical protein